MSQTEAQMREYLEFHANFNREHAPKDIMYAGPEDWLLKHGKPMQTSSRARPVGIRKLANKLCYSNTYRRAVEHNWRYCEGYAHGSVIPVWHAWCLDDNGFVVETTWKETGSAYLGVVLPEDLLHEVMMETRYYGLFQNMDAMEKLLTGQYDERIDKENQT